MYLPVASLELQRLVVTVAVAGWVAEVQQFMYITVAEVQQYKVSWKNGIKLHCVREALSDKTTLTVTLMQ